MEAVRFEFQDCEFLDNGKTVKIPNGIWNVAELDIVTIWLSNGIEIRLYRTQFNILKAQKMAIKITNNY